MLIQTMLNKDSPRLMFSLLVDLQNYFIIILFLIILEEVNLSSIKILGIDAGGTFTDFVLIEIGTSISLRIHKSLSTPSAPEQAILDGIRDLQLEQEVAAGGLSIIHGSTVATNAVLEGKVAKTVFVTNKGFADLLQLARQTRPSLYQLEFEPAPPPVDPTLCLEIDGRLAADGSVLNSFDATELDTLVKQIQQLKPAAVAINLLFSFLDDSFEKRIYHAIKTADPTLFVSRSSAVLPEYKEYERGIATWLNASLGPVISGYLSRLQSQISNCSLQIMQSSGETISASTAAERAVNLLLSGPAGGLTAVHYLGVQTGRTKLLSFDMGGTSTDVSLLDGEISTTNEGRIASYPIAVPMVDMHTIGAGGGSIAYVDDGGMLQVGPKSAGAEPGPACYNHGGDEATVTDANLVLGRLLPGAAFAGGLQLSLSHARNAILKLAKKIDLSVEETALGIVQIVNEHMAGVLRLISVNRGYDPNEFELISFGGAGGLHVCDLAEAMQMNRAIVPIHGGVLSALGMVVAKKGRQFSKTISTKLMGTEWAKGNIASIDEEFAQLAKLAREQLSMEGISVSNLSLHLSADLRYIGQSYTLNVEWKTIGSAIAAFHALHAKRYGYALNLDTELVNIRVHAQAKSIEVKLPPHQAGTSRNNSETGKIYGCAEDALILSRSDLEKGRKIVGPAIISEYSATTYIAPSWSVSTDALGNLLLEKFFAE
jgi:N-methylhydantoinase A